MTGHAVLAVPVPELDDDVRRRTAADDASYLGRGDGFVNAHVTVLYPWREHPSDDDLEAVARVAAAVEPFDATLAEVTAFPSGTIALLAEPVEPFSRLTVGLVAAFPDLAAYEGAFDDPVPHLSLEQEREGVDEESVRRELAARLPVRTRVDRLDLQWWQPDACRLLHSWRLGTGEPV